MILPDWKIEQYVEEGKIEIEPFSTKQLQPHSYDLKLGEDLLMRTGIVQEWKRSYLPQNILIFCLGTTLERIKLPDNIVAQVDGKSTLGRLGLSVHQTAGWIDAGFNGNITLELNPVDEPVSLTEGMLIAQIIFMETESARRPYGHPSRNSHYQNQNGVTPPRGLEDL